MKMPERKAILWSAFAVVAMTGLYWGWPTHAVSGNDAETSNSGMIKQTAGASATDRHIDLSDTQIKLIKVGPVEERIFVPKRDAVGSIAFNDDKSVQVFSTYPGKITEIFTDVGRDVEKGQPLYAVDSPDLLQAESTLISAASVRELTTRALERARQLFDVQGISQKDLQQAISDQQSAEGAYKAARDAVRIFGKTEAQIDILIANRHVDATLLVRSPISGKVVTRNAAPGVLTQPGTAPAPFTVTDISVMWMLANVPESDVPVLRLGQTVEVRLMAYPDRLFQGKITNIGATVDPNTHRALVRSEVGDAKHELRSGMLANFVIRAGETKRSPAVTLDGIVREGDGTMTTWVTTDRHRFFKRTVTIGLQQDGYYQILMGVMPGEMVATEGAIFLSHAYETETR